MNSVTQGMEEEWFRVDPYYKDLSKDEADRPHVWGTNLVAYPVGELGAAFAERYERVRAKAAEELPGTGLAIYPLHALHITMVVPSLFTLASVPPELRLQFEEEWRVRLAAWAASQDFPAVFSVSYREMRLEKAAGFFLVRDDSDTIGAIRRKLKGVGEEIQKLNPAFPAPRTPEIVHSTFLRYVCAPILSEAEVRERFRQLQEAWGDDEVRVPCKILCYVREVRPYLHQNFAENVLGEFPYRENLERYPYQQQP